MTNDPILTVGHSNHPLDDFLALLTKHRVAVVADVRSVPWSRFNPHFGREALAAALAARGIDYDHLGRELGGRPDDSACRDEDGRVDYERVAATRRFRDGLARVTSRAAERRVALMCAEKEPLDCHRTLLVAPALDGEGFRVEHVLADGGLESHGAAMDRLMASFDLDPDGDLFRSRDETVARAVRLRVRRLASAGGGSSRGTERFGNSAAT